MARRSPIMTLGLIAVGVWIVYEWWKSSQGNAPAIAAPASGTAPGGVAQLPPSGTASISHHWAGGGGQWSGGGGWSGQNASGAATTGPTVVGAGQPVSGAPGSTS